MNIEHWKPLFKRNVQIALPWSPLHHRAIHVCITIFQHIYQRTRFVFIHNPHHHHRHHQFHRQRWHNCPHHRHSSNWATPCRQWHKHISHRHSGIQVYLYDPMRPIFTRRWNQHWAATRMCTSNAAVQYIRAWCTKDIQRTPGESLKFHRDTGELRKTTLAAGRGGKKPHYSRALSNSKYKSMT